MKVCPLLREWLDSPDSRGWLRNPRARMDPRIRRFLKNFVDVAECRNRDTWRRCARLEAAQGLI